LYFEKYFFFFQIGGRFWKFRMKLSRNVFPLLPFKTNLAKSHILGKIRGQQLWKGEEEN
jgi:hypothetical protein